MTKWANEIFFITRSLLIIEVSFNKAGRANRENSPAIYGWVWGHEYKSESRQGRKEFGSNIRALQPPPRFFRP